MTAGFWSVELNEFGPLHEYELPPEDALSEIASPKQYGPVLLAVAVGLLTVTVVDAVVVQLPTVTVTV